MSLTEPNGADQLAGSSWLTPWRFAALLAALVAISFPRVLIGQQAFAYLDYGQFAYPVAFQHHQAFWEGAFPFWNPLSSCGIPFMAQWNTQTLYPPSLFYLLFPMPWSAGVFCLLHLVLGGVGVYLLAVRWTRSQLAAAVAGAIFAFNGFSWYAIVWPHILAALGWMPWVVLTMERAWIEGGRRVVLAGAPAGLQFLSGGAEVILLTWFFLGGLWCLHLFTKTSGPKALLVRAVLSGCLAVGFAAPQLLPFLDLLAHSQRGTAYGSAEMGVMPLWGWANYLVPVFHTLKNPQGVYVPPNHWTGSWYLGSGVIVLAIIGVIRARGRITWLMLGYTLFSLFMALGGPGKFYSLVTAVVPVLGFMRFPVKFVILATFLIPLLAAFGLASWQNATPAQHPKQKQLLLTLLAVVTALIGLMVGWAYASPLNATDFVATARSAVGRLFFLMLIAGGLLFLQRQARNPSRPESVAKTADPNTSQARSETDRLGSSVSGRNKAGLVVAHIALVVVLWFDVLTHNANLSPTINPAALQPNAIRQFFGWDERVSAGVSRVMQSPAAYQRMLSVGYTDLEVDTQGRRLGQFFNYNLLDFVPKVDGFYSLYPREHHALFERLYFGTNHSATLQDFLGVSFISDPASVVGWLARPSFMPFATAGQRVLFRDDASALDFTLSEHFDPRQNVYLPLDAQGQVQAGPATPARTALESFSPGRIVVQVETDAPTMLVLAQTYYHNWKATVNDRAVPLWRANYCFQAIDVPAGKSRVAVVYRDHAFFVGLGIFALALIGALGLWSRVVWRNASM